MTKNQTVVEKNDIGFILNTGLCVWKNCFRSIFKPKFQEGIPKYNDVYGMLNLFDMIDVKRISVERIPCVVYNKESTTSCQNNIELVLNNSFAENKLVETLRGKTFKHEYCQKARDRIINLYGNMFKKQIHINEFFKNSFMITVDKSKIELTHKVFRHHFGDFFPNVVNGFQGGGRTNVQNCLKSHYSIIYKAKYNKLPFVVVFEDDAYPITNCKDFLEKYLCRIPKDAGFVLLGWSNYSKKSIQKFDKPFNPMSTVFSGSHSYILFQNSYDKYLKTIDKNTNTTADCHIFNAMEHPYAVNYPIFIQYNRMKSMNKHIGYILYGDNEAPPPRFEKIEAIIGK